MLTKASGQWGQHQPHSKLWPQGGSAQNLPGISTLAPIRHPSTKAPSQFLQN